MRTRFWSSWWRQPQSRKKRTSAWKNWGPVSNIEQLEVRTLLSAINGVSVASRFTLNAALTNRTNVGFTLTSLAADADGDGNVNGRSVTFIGQISPKLGSRPKVQVVDSTGTVFTSTALNNTGSVSTFSLTVTLRNTTSSQLLSFRMQAGGGLHNPIHYVNINKNTGGQLTSLLTVKPVQPGKPDLQPSSDTGSSSSDDYTSDSTPTFNISQIVVGNTVELLRDGVVVASINNAGSSTVSITSPSTSPGTYTYTARQSETAGGITGTVSQSLSVTIDTAVPVKLGPPDLKASTDTGLSNSDNITSSTAPSFDIANTEVGAFVELLRGNTVVATRSNSPGGTITLSVPGSTAGKANYTVRQTDLAGNVSLTSDATTVTIDNVVPVKPDAPDLQDASDTGTSQTDNQTRDTTPTFDISGVEAGARIELLRGGTVVASVISSVAGTVKLTDPFASPGNQTYTARQTDAAGNVSPVSNGLTVTFSTSEVPAPNVPDLLAASDSGFDDSDNITSVSVLDFTVGGIGAGNTVDFLRDGVIIASLVSVDGGTVSFSDRSLAFGTYTYTAVQTNPVGSASSDSLPLVVKFDADTPDAPNTPDLIAESDLGTSDSDNLTSDTSPSFAIGNVEADALVELLRDDVVVASLTSPSAGTVILSDSTASGGTYSYTARQTDRAGNVISTTESLVVVFDMTAPAAPSPPNLDDFSDTGISDVDNVTSSTSPSFSIGNVEENFTVLLLRDGAVVASVVAATAGSITLVDPAVASGFYHYSAVQIDAAGNIDVDGFAGSANHALEVTIDAVVPSAPFIPNLDPSQDTGFDDVDDITSTFTPVFTIGGIVPGNSVQLLRNGVLVNSIDSVSGDTVSLNDPTAPEGTLSYTARQRSVAGLDSNPSTPLTVQIDRIGPVTPDAPDLTAASDTGFSSADNITRSKVLDFEVTNIEAGATVELFRGGVLVASKGNVDAGTVTLNDPTALEGPQEYTVRVTDLAGNVGVESPGLTVTVNTAAPAKPGAPDLDAGSDKGRLSTDNVTNVSGAQFNISGITVGNSVDLLRDGVVVDSLDNAANTTVSLSDLSTPVGGVVYTAQQRSAAGVAGAVSDSLSVTYDKTAPSAPTGLDLQTASDTGPDTADNMTMDPTPTFDISNIEVGASVRLLRNGSVVATLPSATAGVNALTDPSAPLGTHSYTVRQIDLAGNASTDSAALTVTIQANLSNHLPVAVDDNYVAQINTPLTVTGLGVLANDTDADGDSLTAVFGGTGGGGGGGGGTGPGPFHGDVVLNTNGTFTYTPDTDYVGTDTFKYHANDGFGNSNVVVVTINVVDPSADDHGNSAATATFVSVPSTTAGNLEVAGDVDWFRFTKVAGTSYIITTILGSGASDLSDSIITLYDNDGTTVLRSDDDSGPGLGSRITYTANQNGSLYVKVEGLGGNKAGTYSLVMATPAAPVVRTTAGANTSQLGAVVLIDPDATVTDNDSANFAGGSLVVRITSGAGPGDAIRIRKVGTGTGQVNSAGKKLRLGKIVIGTLSGGTKGSPLTATLNSGATPDVMQTVIRNLTFNSTQRGLTATPRVISITLTDESGLQSQPAVKTVNVSL